jgi:phospholipid/cholesterol/gamma-HCH transport system substrate-binding protein
MNQKRLSLEFKVGLFVLVAIIAVVAFIFSTGRFISARGYELKVSFNYVSGLEIGSPVRVSGLRVGEVSRMDISREVQPKIIVTLKLKPDIRLGRHSQISIRSLGIIGEKYVEISPTVERDEIRPGESIVGVDPLELERFVNVGSDIIRNTDKVLSDIEKIVGDPEVQKNIRSIVANANTTLAKSSEFMDRMNTLSVSLGKTNQAIQELVVENKDRIGVTLDAISGLAVNSKHLVGKVEARIDQFGKTEEEFRDLAADGRKFLGRLQNEGLIAQMLKEEKLFDELNKEMVSLQGATKDIQKGAAQMTVFLDDAGAIAHSVREGQGTVGKLIMNDDLYRELNDFIKDIKQNPWKLFIIRHK